MTITDKPNLRLVVSNKKVEKKKEDQGGLLSVESSIERNEVQKEFIHSFIHSLNSLCTNAVKSKMSVSQVADSLNDALLYVAITGMNNMQTDVMRMSTSKDGKKIHIQVVMEEEE